MTYEGETVDSNVAHPLNVEEFTKVIFFKYYQKVQLNSVILHIPIFWVGVL